MAMTALDVVVDLDYGSFRLTTILHYRPFSDLYVDSSE